MTGWEEDGGGGARRPMWNPPAEVAVAVVLTDGADGVGEAAAGAVVLHALVSRPLTGVVRRAEACVGEALDLELAGRLPDTV